MPVPNSNRSPSPISSRTSPHSRNSEKESNSTARRSFSGNPFPKPSALNNPRGLNPPTPVNSPSGFGRRLSGGKEAEKENDHNTKTAKSWSGSIGSKNFMAPTISAAYKLTPSPRKKVLVDRNEPIRTSISLSEGKVSFFSSNDEDIIPKSESSIDQKISEAHLESNANDSGVLERPSGSKSSKRVTFADSTLDSREFGGESVQFDSDCVVTEMNSKDKSFSDSSMSPVIAPLDADPSLPPYDPRTNYLSPRPQFLHYKPNPRIEVLLNKEKGTDDGGVKRLEDSFTCFENSDTDGMEESSNGDDSQRETEDSSGAETEPLIVKDEDLSGSETLVCDDSNVHEDSESIKCGGFSGPENQEKVVQGKEKEKKGLVARWRSICVLVLLLLSCCSIFVTYSPSTNSAKILEVFNTSQLHQPAAVVDLAKANLNVFTQRFKQFSIESVSHLSLLINNLGHGDKLTILQFMNLTELQNDILVGGHLTIPQGSEIYPENIEWNDVEEKWVALEEEKGDEAAEFSEDETFEDSVSESTNDNEKESENDLVLTAEALPLSATASVIADEIIGNQEEPAAHLDTEFPDDIKPEHCVSLAPEVYEAITESNPENYGGDVYFGENVELLSEDMNLIPSSDEIHSPISELPSDTNPISFLGNSTSKRSVFYLLGGTSILLALVAIAFATFIKKRRGSGSEKNVGVDRTELQSTKTNLAKSGVEQLYQGKLCSNNWPTEDDVGESCPSEMSSFRRSSSQSHNTMLRSANEAQSGERRARKHSKRESFSSSDISLGASPSYGSFTTYERIPIKNAAGDDEVVTPVRRSSRLIRSHVTS